MEQGLRRREQHSLLHIGRPPLGPRIKDPQSVHLIPEKLSPHRGLHSWGVHIQDAAPEGKLARPLHLLAADIARLRQVGGQLLQISGLSHLQNRAGALQRLRREGALEQGLHSGHQTGDLPPGQTVEEAETPVLPLSGDRGDVVEQKGPGGQHRDLPACEEGQVSSHPLRLPLVGAHHHHRAAALLPQAGGEVGPVDRRQSGHRHRGLSAVQRCQQLLKFRQLSQNRAEYLHQISLLVPIYPMIWKSKSTNAPCPEG